MRERDAYKSTEVKKYQLQGQTRSLKLKMPSRLDHSVLYEYGEPLVPREKALYRREMRATSVSCNVRSLRNTLNYLAWLVTCSRSTTMRKDGVMLRKTP